MGILIEKSPKHFLEFDLEVLEASYFENHWYRLLKTPFRVVGVHPLPNFFHRKCIYFLIFDIKLGHFIEDAFFLWYKHSSLVTTIDNRRKRSLVGWTPGVNCKISNKCRKIFWILFQGTEYSSNKNVEEQDDDDEEEDIVIASLVAPQTGQGRQQQQIGWLCGEPMPDYAHVVFKSTR